MKRRQLIKSIALGSLGLTTSTSLLSNTNNIEDDMDSPLKNNINHSVCSWTYGHLSIEELCILVKKIGFNAIDLVGPKGWPILKKHGVYSSMCNGAEISLVEGWNNPKNHDTLIKNYTTYINLVADAGYKNLICFSGNRNGMSNEEGLKHCTTGLQKIMPLAEQRGIIIQMELFNSKIDHKDYMCDNTNWGIALCKLINSANFKLLYDIYHMQINEGDVIRTIQNHHNYFGHYHTAGVPGRHEIDETQELYYPAIMKAILATGYKGYVAQEFIPTSTDNKIKIKALRKAIKICDV
jgi:hydroxypyruvate isomerase